MQEQLSTLQAKLETMLAVEKVEALAPFQLVGTSQSRAETRQQELQRCLNITQRMSSQLRALQAELSGNEGSNMTIKGCPSGHIVAKGL
ncbi:hypothetical protein [Fibrella forsythiae]|uniref:Uncharacterized protein n=1 Tax=Fibrella forsythiae TaxID=2817061 RepID=A0ABS3JDF2_9BACT|nr:hypothetical protein [Fibrella forsythiae]MBO0947294.1 hypothetical protein [Fibrella forsythiae]